MMCADTDAALLLRSRCDPDAFTDVFDRHAPAVHRYLARRAGSQIADDLTGEVFTRAFAGRHTYNTTHPEALPWLYGIAHNVLRSDARGRARESSAGARWAGRADPDTSYQDVDDRVDAQRQPVLDVLASLPADEREVLLLVAWEDLTPTQAATALNIPAGTARSRLHRARTLLRAGLQAPPHMLLPTSCKET